MSKLKLFVIVPGYLEEHAHILIPNIDFLLVHCVCVRMCVFYD